MITCFCYATAVCSQLQGLNPQPLISLARAAIMAEVRHQAAPRVLGHHAPSGAFITIERNGKVLGCRGNLQPRGGSLELTIVQDAEAAACHDPRHQPVQLADLASMKVTVTVVDHLTPIESVDGLPTSDGLVLCCGSKIGVVLPWEGRDPRIRLKWAFEKAGVGPSSSVKLFRLVGERWRG